MILEALPLLVMVVPFLPASSEYDDGQLLEKPRQEALELAEFSLLIQGDQKMKIAGRSQAPGEISTTSEPQHPLGILIKAIEAEL